MENSDLKNLAKKVLEDAFVMSLGVVDSEGVWVADVIYIPDNKMNLYWISLQNTRHSKAIEENNKVACTITASWETNNERALQIEGIAERAEPSFEREQKLETKRGLEMPNKEGDTLSDGQVWYVLRPHKIRLIHSKPFGYSRKDIIL